MKKSFLISSAFVVALIIICNANAQNVTGVWKGKVKWSGVFSVDAEIKMIKKGDSIIGTAYYYHNKNNYSRYTIKGYFDPYDNSVNWKDDVLLENKSSGDVAPTRKPFQEALNMVADFNCPNPNSGRMFLDGKIKKENGKEPPLHLEKKPNPYFEDEWDFVIDNYTVGANDPRIIDSISTLAFNKPAKPLPPPVVVVAKPVEKPKPIIPKKEQPPVVKKEAVKEKPVVTPAVVVVEKPVVIVPLTNEQKLTTRTRKVETELPILGDSIELNFYDNAEIDGDSIALYLNNKLLVEHVKLGVVPYVLKIAIKDLQHNNELVMVAENLGAIPPNTAMMIAYVNKSRYEANLESTEQTSAVIRFVRKE